MHTTVGFPAAGGLGGGRCEMAGGQVGDGLASADQNSVPACMGGWRCGWKPSRGGHPPPGLQGPGQPLRGVLPTLGVTAVQAGGSSEVLTLPPWAGGAVFCSEGPSQPFPFLQMDLPRGSLGPPAGGPGRRNCCGAWSHLSSGPARGLLGGGPRDVLCAVGTSSPGAGAVLLVSKDRPRVGQRSTGRSSARSPCPRVTSWLTDRLVCLLCPR